MTDRSHDLYEDQHHQSDEGVVKELCELRADRGLLIVENSKLRERVDYLEDAIKNGGAAYRVARLELDAPALDDDYLVLKAAKYANVSAAALSDVDTGLSPAEALDLVVEQGAVLRHEYKNLAVSELCRLRERIDTLETRIALKDGVERERDDLRAKVARQRRELRRLNRDVALLRAGKAEKPSTPIEALRLAREPEWR